MKAQPKDPNFLEKNEDKIAHVGGGLIGGALAYYGMYQFLTEFTSLDYRYSKVISGVFATLCVATLADYKERNDNFYDKKDFVCGVIPAFAISVGFSFTFGKPPKPTLRVARKKGNISSFGYVYMSDFYKRSYTKSDDSTFCVEFENLEDSMLVDKKFIPKLEKEFLDSSFIIEGSPNILLVEARKMKIIKNIEYRSMKKFYKYNCYDPKNMSFFIRRYEEIKYSVDFKKSLYK